MPMYIFLVRVALTGLCKRKFMSGGVPVGEGKLEGTEIDQYQECEGVGVVWAGGGKRRSLRLLRLLVGVRRAG